MDLDNRASTMNGTAYETDVPVVDLSAPLDGAMRRIGRACAEWGFFQVVGHGIDSDLMAAAMLGARRFFTRPTAQKRAMSRSVVNPWGYYDRELTKNLRDKKEIFDIGPEAPEAAGDGGLWAAHTPWPSDEDGFRATMRAYADACEALSRWLLGSICLSLGVDRNHLDDAFSPASTSFLRLNHYPVRDPLEDDPESGAPGADLGIHRHTDAGAVTILLQDDVDGLQVWRDDGWRIVAPTPGALVVNIGDMVQVWSNDLYRAPVHRVLAMDVRERLSLALFYNPAYEVVVAPIESCPAPDRVARYRPIPWGEFRQRRADGDFADHGAEVQISDYRI